MAAVNVIVYYLEMLTHAKRVVPPPRGGLTVIHAQRPPVAYYRYLYTAVGKDYHWLTRGKLTDAELAALIQNPLDEIHVLHAGGVPAGFAELDRRKTDDIELVQFGLTRDFIGQGLGKWFLQWVIDRAWSYQPKRFWLHTCTLDHPAALPNYQKAGFIVYQQEVIQRDI